MIRLIHAARGYTSDGARDLSLSELLRLLVLGGKLQVEACVAQCVDKVGMQLGYGSSAPAMEVLEGIPNEMDGVKGVAGLRDRAFIRLTETIRHRILETTLELRAWRLVIAAIEAQAKTANGVEARLWKLVDDSIALRRLGEAKPEVERMVVRYLGPLHRLWEVDSTWSVSWWSEAIPAKAKVRHCPSPPVHHLSTPVSSIGSRDQSDPSDVVLHSGQECASRAAMGIVPVRRGKLTGSLVVRPCR
jgi:hypothetical protein